MTDANAYLDLETLRTTPVDTDPFDHIILPGFIRNEVLQNVHNAYPKVGKPGSYPMESLEFGQAFAEMAAALRGPELAAILAEKFDMDLSGRPTMLTVRDMCRLKDGQIHTDSNGKLITVLLYMNPQWEETGGRLRLLRSNQGLDDYVTEVPPQEGTLLAFKCTPDAWHGHKPFEGQRRTLQLNYVVDQSYLTRENRRHRVSAFFKKLRFAS